MQLPPHSIAGVQDNDLRAAKDNHSRHAHVVIQERSGREEGQRAPTITIAVENFDRRLRILADNNKVMQVAVKSSLSSSKTNARSAPRCADENAARLFPFRRVHNENVYLI